MARTDLTDHEDLRELADELRTGPWGHLPNYRDAILDQIASTPSVLERSARPGHLTGSAFVVDAAMEHTLVMFHTKLQLWLQPGGHADGNANLASVALREATEETGIEGLRVAFAPIDIDIHRVDPPREDAHDHLDIRYLVVAPPDAVVQGNHESEALRWVTFEELPALGVDDGLLRMASRGFARGRQLDL